MDKSQIEVVIDGKVYKLAGAMAENSIQRIAAYVDSMIKSFKRQKGYYNLTPEYRNILLALNISEDLFALKDKLDICTKEQNERKLELTKLKHELADKTLLCETSEKLVIEYKNKVNELQRRIIELETRGCRYDS